MKIGPGRGDESLAYRYPPWLDISFGLPNLGRRSAGIAPRAHGYLCQVWLRPRWFRCHEIFAGLTRQNGYEAIGRNCNRPTIGTSQDVSPLTVGLNAVSLDAFTLLLKMEIVLYRETHPVMSSRGR